MEKFGSCGSCEDNGEIAEAMPGKEGSHNSFQPQAQASHCSVSSARLGLFVN